MRGSRRAAILRTPLWVWCVAAFLIAVGRDEAAGEPSHCPRPDAPYQRAMIFSGLGTDFVAYLGMYDAAIDAGYPPDLVVGTSGGAVAAAIVGAYPDREARKRLLTSAEFHEFLLAITVERPRPVPYVARTPRWFVRSHGIAPHPPNLFSRPLASVPDEMPALGLRVPFPTEPDRPRVIIVAARADYDPFSNQRPSRKLFTETWFTDRLTAAYLAGQPSPIGVSYPCSAVALESSVVTDVSMADAARASSVEPHVFIPFSIGGEWYAGGAIDLWPVEPAAALARETIMPKQTRFDRLVNTLLGGVLEYSQWDRKEQVDQFPVTFRVDMEDSREALKDISFWFDLRWVRHEADVPDPSAGHVRPGRNYLIPRPRIVATVPEDADEFIRRVWAQYTYGYDRARQTFGAR
jgi:predicted acylesterase/phospholipase RssA